MKKFTFLMAFLMIFSVMAKSQTVISDFEHLPLNLMKGGEEDNSSFRVVPNPDKGEANPSEYVVKFHRDMDGVPWGGFFAALPEDGKIDLTSDKYIHVQVWKPRISPVKFKVEAGTTNPIEIESINPQTLTGEWETMVFNFDAATGEYGTVVLMPDFNDPVDLTEDIVIYFDNIYVSNSPDIGAAPTQPIEDFEHIKLNWMAAGDDAYMHIVPNPDDSGVNPSNHVVEFMRGVGDPWGGFWSTLPEPLDLTQHKYVYVDVWKPRISPVKFKIEDGPTAHEFESMEPQTKTEEWETLVFDFSNVGGTWPTIALMPDFEDPLTLTEGIVIYFDNIRVGDAPSGGEPGDFMAMDFMWSDFEDQYTNVGGFYEAMNANTVASVLADGGVNGGAAAEFTYTVSADNTSTGYQMWSFPDMIDVSAYNYLVLNVKASVALDNVHLILRDDVNAHQEGNSQHPFSIGTEWHQVFLPLDAFTVQTGWETAADLSILHLVQVMFIHDVVNETTATVHIDDVGFTTDAVNVPVVSLDELTVNVFPNPARSFMDVAAVAGSQISLININGSIVESRIADTGTTRFDVSQLPQGIYFVRVINNHNIVTRKVMVQ
jgi:hypothetical protein